MNEFTYDLLGGKYSLVGVWESLWPPGPKPGLGRAPGAGYPWAPGAPGANPLGLWPKPGTPPGAAGVEPKAGGG